MSDVTYIGTPSVETIERLELRDHEKGLHTTQEIKTLVDNSICAAYVVDDVVIAILGYVKLWDGVIEVWILPSKHLPAYVKTFIKHAKIALDMLMHDEKLHRIQTHSFADPVTDRWMEFMGFVCEGTLVGYTQNRHDYRMWAKYGIIRRDVSNGINELSAG